MTQAIVLCLALVCSASQAGEPSLQDRLVSLANEQLRPAGLSLDAQRARLALSAPVAADAAVDVRPLWSAMQPQLPLVFELRSEGTGVVVTATLAAPLLRDAWVAGRRLAKGSAVACVDLVVQRRELKQAVVSTPLAPCELAADSVALRDVAKNDVVRPIDLGALPAVMAGAAVRLDVAAGGVSVATNAVALADAQVGDLIDVRLQRPLRTLKARVTAPSAVQLTDASEWVKP